MNQQHKFSLGYSMLVFFTILFLESMFFSGTAVKEISYSNFRSLLAEDKIKSVIVESDRIFGLQKAPKETRAAPTGDTTSKESTAFQPPRKQAPWHLNFSLFNDGQDQTAERQFVVTRLNDPKLIDDLQAMEWTTVVRSNPIGFLIFCPTGLCRCCFSSCLGDFWPNAWGKGVGFLDAGKSKARIYAVDPSRKVTFNDVAGVDEAVEEVKEVVSFLKEPDRYTGLAPSFPKAFC